MINSKFGSYSYYIQQFEETRKEAKKLIIPLDERLFRRQPSAKTWCIGECFSHLIETGNLYYAKVQKGIGQTEKNSSTNSENLMHIRFHMQWFVNYLEPPVSFKTKAPTPFKPVKYADLNKDKILNDFLLLQDQYLAQIEYAKKNDINLGEIKVSNPLYSFIKMLVSECIAIVEAHQRRHIQQANNILNQL